MMKPVFLIGYMGCGKTTLGEVLARQMGLRFIDLDEFIEARQVCQSSKSSMKWAKAASVSWKPRP